MLKGNPNVFHYTTFRTADKIFSQHPIWQQAKIEAERKRIFEEYVAELKEREVVNIILLGVLFGFSWICDLRMKQEPFVHGLPLKWFLSSKISTSTFSLAGAKHTSVSLTLRSGSLIRNSTSYLASIFCLLLRTTTGFERESMRNRCGDNRLRRRGRREKPGRRLEYAFTLSSFDIE